MPDPKKGLFDDDDESEKTEHSQPGQPPKPPEKHDDLNYEDDEATVVAPSEKKPKR